MMVAATKSVSNIDIQNLTNQIYKPRAYTNPVSQEDSFTSRRKLFAILVMIRKPQRIIPLIQKGIGDEHLPFQTESVTRDPRSSEAFGLNHLLEVDGNGEDSWTDLEVDLVSQYQWYLLAPVFKMSGPKLAHYSLSKGWPLPFIQDITGLNDAVQGGFGDVRKVKIHPAHHDLNVREDELMTAVVLTNFYSLTLSISP